MSRFHAMTVALALLAGCDDADDEPALGPDGVTTAGAADFTRYVAIGDSYAAGVVNGAFTCSGQIYAYPALIARQVGLEIADACNPPEELTADFSTFQQPLVTDPGVGSPLVLTSPGPPPVITLVSGRGVPTNGALRRPYNNLGVPGGEVVEVNAASNQQTSHDDNGAFNIVLRGRGTAPQQARTLDATFITFWLGGNDALEAVLSGGTTPVTTPSAFDTEYRRALDDLLEVTPEIVVGNVADVTFLPFASTIPAVVVNPATGQPVLVGGQPVPLIGAAGPLALGQDLVLLSAASLLGQGIGVPAALGGTGQPLPDQVVLDATEVAEVRDAIAAYNRTISEVAAEHGLELVDIASAASEALNNLSRPGIVEGSGYSLSLRFLGDFPNPPFFGLDGFHPTPKGYGHLGNLFITAINAKYSASIPLVDVNALPLLIDLPEPPVVSSMNSRSPFTPAHWPAGLDTSGW